MKKHVIIGLLLCLASLILLHQGQVIIGLPGFIIGFLIMQKGGINGKR